MKQLHQLLQNIIPKYNYFKAFVITNTCKNSFQSFRFFWKRWLSFKTNFKIEFLSEIMHDGM